MSNRRDSRQHGLHMVERLRQKSKLRVRRNKANNRVRQQENQVKLQEAIAASGK